MKKQKTKTRKSVVKRFKITNSKRFCPVCRVSLCEVGYDSSKVKVDFCKMCEGVWLNRGEFKQIINYLKNKSDYEILHHYTKNFVSELWEVFSGPEKFRSELEALKVFNGRGSIQLLESDDDKNAILIERAIPGAPLTSVKNDEEEMSIAATIMKNLWQPVPSGHQFHSVSDWGKGFEKMKEYFKEKPNPLPKELVDKAERLFTGLSASQGEQVLLHGDLNHSNILSAQREPWLAIDPKGVIGEREYEIGVLLRNPQPELLRLPDPKEVLERRIDQLANELNLDRERTHGWGIAQAVLSAWWIIEDNGNDWEDAIACAEILNQIKIQT